MPRETRKISVAASAKSDRGKRLDERKTEESDSSAERKTTPARKEKAATEMKEKTSAPVITGTELIALHLYEVVVKVVVKVVVVNSDAYADASFEVTCYPLSLKVRLSDIIRLLSSIICIYVLLKHVPTRYSVKKKLLNTS
jgi:hypothetical protein